MIPIEFFLLLGAILFSIGAYGVVTKSNAIIVLMCIELMLNAANINFVAFGAFHPDIMGQAFVIVTITVGSAALHQHDPRPFRYRHPAQCVQDEEDDRTR